MESDGNKNREPPGTVRSGHGESLRRRAIAHADRKRSQFVDNARARDRLWKKREPEPRRGERRGLRRRGHVHEAELHHHHEPEEPAQPHPPKTTPTHPPPALPP